MEAEILERIVSHLETIMAMQIIQVFVTFVILLGLAIIVKDKR